MTIGNDIQKELKDLNSVVERGFQDLDKLPERSDKNAEEHTKRLEKHLSDLHKATEKDHAKAESLAKHVKGFGLHDFVAHIDELGKSFQEGGKDFAKIMEQGGQVWRMAKSAAVSHIPQINGLHDLLGNWNDIQSRLDPENEEEKLHQRQTKSQADKKPEKEHAEKKQKQEKEAADKHKSWTQKLWDGAKLFSDASKNWLGDKFKLREAGEGGLKDVVSHIFNHGTTSQGQPIAQQAGKAFQQMQGSNNAAKLGTSSIQGPTPNGAPFAEKAGGATVGADAAEVATEAIATDAAVDIGLTALASDLGVVAAGFATVGIVVGTVSYALGKMGTAILESNRQFAEFSGSMAAVFAKYDVEKIYSNQRVGEATAGTADYLADTQIAFTKSLEPFSELWHNTTNILGGVITEMATGILNFLGWFPDKFNQLLTTFWDWLFGSKGGKNTQSGWDLLGNMAGAGGVLPPLSGAGTNDGGFGIMPLNRRVLPI